MTIRQLFASFRRRFSNRASAIQTRTGVERLPGRSWRTQWIVGRDLCLYRCESFANVPRNRRQAALALKIPVWSPFDRTGHHCIWMGAVAMVWLWDQEAVKPDIAVLGTRNAEAARVLPESAFHPPRPDGACLRSCRHGYELQRWRDGVLEDSFWSPERPAPSRLAWFLDGDAAAIPEAPGELAAEPWSNPPTPREWLLANERSLALAVLTVVALASVWQEVRIWKFALVADAIASERARRDDVLGPALAIRDELRRLNRANGVLADILNEPSQAHLMGRVDRAIPDTEAIFQSWRYQQGELRLIVAAPNIDTVAYVTAMNPHFGQVDLASSQRQGRIEMVMRLAP